MKPIFLLHSLCYITVFIVSYYFSWTTNNHLFKIVWLCGLGWSIFGFTSIGHEIYHINNYSNQKYKLFYDISGFIFMDLWSVNKHNWMMRHNEWHHKNLWEEGEEEHLMGLFEPKEFLNTALTLIKTYRLLNFSLSNILIICFRIWFFSLISWYAIFIVYINIIILVTCLTFITHSAPVIITDEKFIMKQLHRSVDIFPNSWLMFLIAGSFNIHGSHHVRPSLFRDDLYKTFVKLSTKYDRDYRYIETYRELFSLWKNRNKKYENLDFWYSEIKQTKIKLN